MTVRRPTRRALLGATAGAALAWRSRRPAAAAAPAFAYPIGDPDRAPGDGFAVRIGYACENLPFFPGWWHTGENWHRLEGETGGAPVLAAAAGEVVFAGYDYPGPVVVLRHAPDLFSVYGHLDYALAVAGGDAVERGQPLGTVLARADKPGHLHFEVRTFFVRREINGDAPSFGVHCGYQCPPGPGYWPLAAPEHPSDLGWRNPTHAIARRAFAAGSQPLAQVAEDAPALGPLAVWAAPDAADSSTQIGALPARPGDRYPILAVEAGDEAATGSGAGSYRLWYRLSLPDGGAGWVQAALASGRYAGANGEPSEVRFALLPVVA